WKILYLVGVCVKPIGMNHFYQLRPVFDLIPDLPDALSAERKYFEDLISGILIQYKARLSRKRVLPFEFHSEAQQYFSLAYRAERRVRYPESQFDMVAARQTVYDNYYHGLYYYMGSIFIREPVNPENALFLAYCRAWRFMARVDWDGTVLPVSSAKNLPKRERVFYFGLRDQAALRQFAVNPEFAASFKEALNGFPSERPPLRARSVHHRHHIRRPTIAANPAAPNPAAANPADGV
ncbi:MAG: hypothetical protein WCF85_10725, partial [Rhodospirillaceae bacterium]